MQYLQMGNFVIIGKMRTVFKFIDHKPRESETTELNKIKYKHKHLSTKQDYNENEVKREHR